MLQLSDRQVSIHECRFEGYFDQINVNLKFPCNFFIQWNSINGKQPVQTQTQPKTKSNIIVFDQKLRFSAQLIYDKRKKKYLKKQCVINVNLTSKHRPDQVKLVGRITVDLSQVINNSQYKQVSRHKLNYCSVQSEISFSIKLIRSELLNKSISDLDKSSFHDLYSFKVPQAGTTELNSTKETKEQKRVKIHVQEAVNVTGDERTLLDQVFEEQRSQSKDKKDYKRNQNIILINERNKRLNKQKLNQKNGQEARQGTQESKERRLGDKGSNQKQLTSNQSRQKQSQASSVQNLPISEKDQPPSQSNQKQLINKIYNRQTYSPQYSPRILSDQAVSGADNQKVQVYQQQIDDLKRKIESQEKQMKEQEVSINELQEKIRYFERIIKESRLSQEELDSTKIKMQLLHKENERLSQIEFSLREYIQQKQNQILKYKATNGQLQERAREINFSLNQEIVTYKQKIQSLQLRVKEKEMQIEFSNKKTLLIEQSFSHFRQLQIPFQSGSANSLITSYQETKTLLKQQVFTLQQRVKQLEAELVKARDPSCYAPSEASHLSPNGQNNWGPKSELHTGSEKEIVKAQETIYYLAREKELLLVEKNTLTQANRVLEGKLTNCQNEVSLLKEQLKKVTQKLSTKDQLTKQPVDSETQNIHEQSINLNKGIPNITPSQQPLQTISKLQQLQKSVEELNILNQENKIADPLKAVLMAQLEMLKLENKRISQELFKLKISIKEPMPHEEQKDQTIVMDRQMSGDSPQLNSFSKELQRSSLRGPTTFNTEKKFIEVQGLDQNNPPQTFNSKTSPVEASERQLIQSINEIESSKKSKLLLETKHIDQLLPDHHKQNQQPPLLENNSGPNHPLSAFPQDNIRFSQTGKPLKGTVVPVLKKNTESVWDMESNFSSRYNQRIDNKTKGSNQISSVNNSIISKHTELIDDNQFRIMSIDDQAEVQQLRIIVKELKTKLKNLSQVNATGQKKLREMEGQKNRIEKQYTALIRQHEQSSNELEKVWKEKQDLIYELMFGKQSSIVKPEQEFCKQEPIYISVKESQRPLLAEQSSSNLDSSSNRSPQSSISKARSGFNNRGRLFVDTAALTQINEEASFLEDTMLRLSNLEETYRNFEYISNHIGESSSTRKQLDVIKNQITCVKDKFAIIEESNAKLRKQVDFLKKQLQIKKDSFKKQLEVKEVELSQKQGNQLTQIEKIREIVQARSLLDEKIVQVENELKEQRTRAQKLQIARFELDSESKKLSQQLSLKEKQLSQQACQISDLKSKVFPLNAEIDSLNHTVSEQQQKLKELNEKIADFQMGVEISKIHEKQPLDDAERLHLDDSLQNHHLDRLYETKRLYLDHHSCVLEIRVEPSSLSSKRLYSKLYISSIVNEFVPPFNAVQSMSKKQPPQIDIKGQFLVNKPRKVIQSHQKPLNSYQAKRQVSESISEIKVVSYSSSLKKQAIKYQSSPSNEVSKKEKQVPQKQGQEHESTVYYSIEDEQQSPKKQKEFQSMRQASHFLESGQFQKPKPSSQKSLPYSYQTKSPPYHSIIPKTQELIEKHVQTLQKKVEELLTEINQKEEYIILLEQEIKSNMNLKNQVEELKELHAEANQTCEDKDRLVQELQDQVHGLIKELENFQSTHHYPKILQKQLQHNPQPHTIGPQTSSPHTLNTPPHKPHASQCSHCSMNLLQLQSTRKELASVYLQLNSNKQEKLHLSQQVFALQSQLTVLKSQNNELRHSYSKLNQEYTVVQTKLQQANNEIDRVKSQLAVRTVNNSRENGDKDYSKDGRDLPRESSHSHELLIISKGVQEKEEPNNDSDKPIKDPVTRQNNQKSKDLQNQLKVKKTSLNRRHSYQPTKEQQHTQNSPKLNKKASEVNIRCTQAQKKSSPSKPLNKEEEPPEIISHWNSCEKRADPAIHLKNSRPRYEQTLEHLQLNFSSLQKGKNMFETKIKEISRKNEQLRDELIQMNQELNSLKKQNKSMTKDQGILNRQNTEMKKELTELKILKDKLQEQLERVKQMNSSKVLNNNDIIIHHIDNSHDTNTEPIMHPQSSNGGQIRQTAKFNPFDDLSPFQKYKIQQDLDNLASKTQLKVDWGPAFAQKIHKTDRSDRSKTSDFKQIISLGGDDPIQPINYTPHHHQTNLNNANNTITNDITVNDVNQSKADLYQDLFFRDQQIEELKILLQQQKEKFLMLEQLCHELREENERMLDEKDVQIQKLVIKTKELERQVKEIKTKQQQLGMKQREMKIKQQQIVTRQQETKKKEQKIIREKLPSKEILTSRDSEELKQKEVQLSEKGQQVKKYHKVNASLAKELTQKVQALTNQQMQIKQLKLMFSERQKQIFSLSSKLLSVETSLMAAAKTQKSLMQQIQQKEQKTSEFEAEKNILASQIEQMRRVNEKVVEKMSVLEKVYTQNYQEFGKIQQDYKQLFADYQAVKQENQIIKLELQSAKPSNTPLRANLFQNPQQNPDTGNLTGQIQSLNKQVQQLRKNQHQYLQEISKIKQQSRQLKRHHLEDFSSTSSILNQSSHIEEAVNQQKKQTILKLLQKISKTFHIFNNLNERSKNHQEIKSPNTTNSREQELFKMISSLALRNELLENQLTDLKARHNNLPQHKRQQPTAKSKQQNNSPSTNNKLVSSNSSHENTSWKSSPKNNKVGLKSSSNNDSHQQHKPSQDQMGKKLSKKMNELKLTLIKHLTPCAQQAKQLLIKNLNEITEIVQYFILPTV